MMVFAAVLEGIRDARLTEIFEVIARLRQSPI
jgi:hypothetical protein